jgi:hypothetical protein
LKSQGTKGHFSNLTNGKREPKILTIMNSLTTRKKKIPLVLGVIEPLRVLAIGPKK